MTIEYFLLNLKCYEYNWLAVLNVWGTRWRSWLRHCATNRKVAGSIPDGVIGIFHWHNPSGRTMALELNQPITEMSKKLKQSRYRPGVAQRVPGSYGSQISWQRHRMVVRLPALSTAAFIPRKYTWYSFLLQAESTGRIVNEKVQWHNRESNPRPASL